MILRCAQEATDVRGFGYCPFRERVHVPPGGLSLSKPPAGLPRTFSAGLPRAAGYPTSLRFGDGVPAKYVGPLDAFLVNRESFMESHDFEKLMKVNDGA